MRRARGCSLAGSLILLRRRRRPPLRPRRARADRRRRRRRTRRPSSSPSCCSASARCRALAFVAVYALDRLPRPDAAPRRSRSGSSLLLLAAALIVRAKRLDRHRGARGGLPGRGAPRGAAADRPDRARQRQPHLAPRPLQARARRRGGSLGARAPRAARLARARVRHRPLLRDAVAARPRLVDESGRPLRAADIEREDVLHRVPAGRDRTSSPRRRRRALDPSAFDLPAELAGYPAQGIVAFSKICTHAACAISLYRAPLFPPTEPRPALVCPCHYSTFDPATGGTVLFGPAGRKLPMLPLTSTARLPPGGRHLRRAGRRLLVGRPAAEADP